MDPQKEHDPEQKQLPPGRLDLQIQLAVGRPVAVVVQKGKGEADQLHHLIDGNLHGGSPGHILHGRTAQKQKENQTGDSAANVEKTGAGPGYQKEYKIGSCHVPEIIESQTPAEIGISIVGTGENEQEQEKEQKTGEMDQQLGQKRAPALQISSAGHDPCGFDYFLFFSAAEGSKRNDSKKAQEIEGKARDGRHEPKTACSPASKHYNQSQNGNPKDRFQHKQKFLLFQ